MGRLQRLHLHSESGLKRLEQRSSVSAGNRSGQPVPSATNFATEQKNRSAGTRIGAEARLGASSQDKLQSVAPRKPRFSETMARRLGRAGAGSPRAVYRDYFGR